MRTSTRPLFALAARKSLHGIPHGRSGRARFISGAGLRAEIWPLCRGSGISGKPERHYASFIGSDSSKITRVSEPSQKEEHLMQLSCLVSAGPSREVGRLFP